jgi:hypothetical protein
MRVLEHLHLVGNALRGLSTLGRLQIFILLFNLVATPTIISVVAADVNHSVDWTALSFCIEFLLFTAITIGYSLSVENEFSFYSLVFLEVEAVCFITACALVGVLAQQSLWVRVLIILWNWLSLVAFLSLQRVLRQNWGWHAYQIAGTHLTALVEYKRYQQLAAAVFLDMYHMVFFVTAEEVLLNNRTWWQSAISLTVAVLTIGLSRPLIVMVRLGRSAQATAIFAVHLIVLGFYLYFAVLNSIADANGDRDVMDDGGNLPQSAQRHLVVAVEWLCVAIRCFFLLTMIRMGALGFSGHHPSTITQHFMSSSHDYLINDDQVSVAGSKAHATFPNREVRVYDATSRVTRSSFVPSMVQESNPDQGGHDVAVVSDGHHEAAEDEPIIAQYDETLLPSLRDFS